MVLYHIHPHSTPQRITVQTLCIGRSNLHNLFFDAVRLHPSPHIAIIATK